MKNIFKSIGFVILGIILTLALQSTVHKFQGFTNLDSLALTSDLTVGGNSTTTGSAVFSGGIVNAGANIKSSVYSTTTAVSLASITLSNAIISNDTIVVNSATTAAMTITLPSSTTLATLLSANGYTVSYKVIMASSSMGTGVITTGAGAVLKLATSSPTTAIIGAGGVGQITAIRIASSTSAVSDFYQTLLIFK
jgi:hypothetical protein